MKKVLYFDNTYPKEWLEGQVRKHGADKLPFPEYRDFLNSQRSYLSDYIPYNISLHGFECSNLVCDNSLFFQKADKYFKFKKKSDKIKKSIKESIIFLKYIFLHRSKSRYQNERKLLIIDKIIKVERPDYLLIREPISIASSFWKKYRGITKVIAYIGVNISHPYKWDPFVYHGIVTLIPTYRDFFQLQGIKSRLFILGVDPRVCKELSNNTEKRHDISFIGLLGTKIQQEKTEVLEYLAENLGGRFNWWGPEQVDEVKYPNLHKTYRGVTAGLDMLKTLKESRIAINLYGEPAGGLALNMRMYEILNAGAFPLFKYAENLEGLFPAGLVETFNSKEECLSKALYWLDPENDALRELRANQLQQYALDNFSYFERVKSIVALMEDVA